jgi:hypothetical protein
LVECGKTVPTAVRRKTIISTFNVLGLTATVTVVWVGIENDEFVMGHLGLWKKVQNIRRDPRVAVSMLGPNTPTPVPRAKGIPSGLW